MAKSRKFHWVYVDRDVAPEIPRRFSVTAYPSLLVLGLEGENIHRFSGFKRPPDFLPELEEGLERYAAYKEGKDWDWPPPDPPALCPSADQVRTLPAPSDEVPGGMVALGDVLWVAQSRRLFEVAPRDGKVLREFDLEVVAQDLATDGGLLYVVDSGWTAGRPILVLDPENGEVVRRITTAANAENRHHAGRGIHHHKGRLYVLESRGLVHELDPESGDILRSLDTGRRWLAGLTFDGERFVCGSREAIHFLDPEALTAVRDVPVGRPLRALAWREGRVLVMEQPVFGFDRNHQRVQVWPRETLIHELALPTEAMTDDQ